MRNRPIRAVLAVLLIVAIGLVVRNQIKVARNREASRLARIEEERKKAEQDAIAPHIREALWRELQPVPLKSCRFERYGEKNDGGYLLCRNLLQDVAAGYSYGISGYDGWGCDIATRRKVPVHQYDCFNTEVPVCKTGQTIFHAECVGGTSRTEEGRLFDTLPGQLTKNGDGARHVVIKMDVEGAEWESLPVIPDEVWQRVDQLVIEMHGVREQQYLDVVRRLKTFFHVAHLHINNFTCEAGHEPVGGWVYEVLFVNKRLDSVDPSRTEMGEIAAVTRNNALAPDCQARAERR